MCVCVSVNLYMEKRYKDWSVYEILMNPAELAQLMEMLKHQQEYAEICRKQEKERKNEYMAKYKKVK